MASVSKKVYERLVAGIKQFQPILAAAKSSDVNEADTVTIIKDMLADVFGCKKHLTSKSPTPMIPYVFLINTGVVKLLMKFNDK